MREMYCQTIGVQSLEDNEEITVTFMELLISVEAIFCVRSFLLAFGGGGLSFMELILSVGAYFFFVRSFLLAFSGGGVSFLVSI